MKLYAKCLSGLAFLILTGASHAAALVDQQEIRLWSGAAPGSEKLALKETVTERTAVTQMPDRAITNVQNPTLTAYLPAQPNGVAVLVIPGGAYAKVVIDTGGTDIARRLNQSGITAFVLKYRLPGEGHANRQVVPLQDAQRAMRLVRANAGEWKLDASRIGAVGTSAGGHLAATLATQFDQQTYAPRNDADKLSARPDFVGLLYPVISMEDALAHPLTREKLLGNKPTAAQIDAFSAEKHVGKNTPPTFIALANDDNEVSPANSTLFYAALHTAGVPAEMHVFRVSGHGFGVRFARDSATQWPVMFTDWLGRNGILQ
jgi:acetyl esterase/lipase